MSKIDEFYELGYRQTKRFLKENKLNALYDFTFSGKRIEQE